MGTLVLQFETSKRGLFFNYLDISRVGKRIVLLKLILWNQKDWLGLVATRVVVTESNFQVPTLCFLVEIGA